MAKITKTLDEIRNDYMYKAFPNEKKFIIENQMTDDECFLCFFNNTVIHDGSMGLDELYDELNKIDFLYSKSIPTYSYEDSSIHFSFLYEINPDADKSYQNLEKDIINICEYFSKLEEYHENEKIVINIYTGLKNITSSAKNKLCSSITNKYSAKVEINIKLINDIKKEFMNYYYKKTFVDSFIFDIDNSNNFLKSPNTDIESIIVNLSSLSIKEIYLNQGKNNGPLYHSNLRYYVKNKKIDIDLQESLNNPHEFWFLNNGIVVICEDYIIHDNNKIELKNFSFVNGGQTTFIIGNSDDALKNFYVTAKIIKITENKNSLIEKISIATNKQKPINTKDLFANSKEMLDLSESMKKNNPSLLLISKRGQEITENFKGKKAAHKKFTPDDVAQIISSFEMQMPGTTKNSKSSLWNETNRQKIFKNVDIKKLYFSNIIKKLIDDFTKEKLKNKKTEYSDYYKTGKLMIFSLINFAWKYKNNSKKICEIINEYASDKDQKKFQNSFLAIETKNIEYVNYEPEGSIEDNTKNKSFNENLKKLVSLIIEEIDFSYSIHKESKPDVSFANYSKNDKNYYSVLMKTCERWGSNEDRWMNFSNLLDNIFGN